METPVSRESGARPRLDADRGLWARGAGAGPRPPARHYLQGDRASGERPGRGRGAMACRGACGDIAEGASAGADLRLSRLVSGTGFGFLRGQTLLQTLKRRIAPGSRPGSRCVAAVRRHRGKSGLRRAGCRVTPWHGDVTKRATETSPVGCKSGGGETRQPPSGVTPNRQATEAGSAEACGKVA